MTLGYGSNRRLANALLALTSLTLVACATPGVKVVPEAPKSRLTQLAERLPASSEASVYLTDLDRFGAGFTRISGMSEDLSRMRVTFDDTFGVDLGDVGSWRAEAGIAPDGGMALGFAEDRSVWLVYVDDTQAFDTFLSTTMRAEAGVEVEAVETRIGDVVVKVLGADIEGQIAWTHFGKLAIVASPQLDPERGGEADIATFVAGLTTLEASDSTAQTAAFTQFEAEFGDAYAFTVFANPESIASSPLEADVRSWLAEELGPEFATALMASATSLGVGVVTDGDVATTHVFMGGDEELVKLARKTGEGTAENPFVGLASEDVILGLGVGVNPVAAWSAYSTFAPVEHLELADSLFARLSRELGLEPERDVLEIFTGNAGFFFYGIDLAQAMVGMQDPMRGLAALELIMGVEFEDAETCAKISASLVLLLSDVLGPEDAFEDLPGVDGVKVLDVMEVGYFLTYEGVLAFSTTALPAEQAARRLSGVDEDPRVATPLSTPLTASAPFGGLYISFSGLARALGPMATANPDARRFFDTVDEVAVRFASSKQGVSIVIDVDLQAAPEAPEGASRGLSPARPPVKYMSFARPPTEGGRPRPF